MAAGPGKLTLLLAAALACALAVSCLEPVEQASLSPGDQEADEPRFDLNEVTLEQLLEAAKGIDGLNSRIARNIVEFRIQNGCKRVEDLLSVPYVGETTFFKLRPHFYVRGGD